MSEHLGSMGETAKALSRNPLGIIALFIVLVYGMAALVLGVAAGGLGGLERVLLVLFLVSFPPAVLWVFRDLVMNHTGKLYSPSDFKEEGNFMEVVTALAAAAAAPKNPTSAPPSDPARLFKAARRVTEAGRAASRSPSILWVDDMPQNNAQLARAFMAAGFAIHHALSTDAALGLTQSTRYDIIISDMGRPEGPRAGYDLLRQLREKGDTTPFIVYSSSNRREHREEARRLGALDSTSDPNELLELVSQVIRG